MSDLCFEYYHAHECSSQKIQSLYFVALGYYIYFEREREHVLIFSGGTDVVPLMFQDFPLFFGGGDVKNFQLKKSEG